MLSKVIGQLQDTSSFSVAFTNSESGSGDLLLGHSDGGLVVLLLDIFVSKSAEHFDVAGRVQVRADSSVSSVSSSSSLGGLIDKDVGDNELFFFKTLDGGVGLEVLQQAEEDLGGLFGPSTKTVVSEFFSLGGSADTVSVSVEWDASSVGNNVLKVFNSDLETQTFDGHGSLIGVLEVDSDVTTAGLDSFSGDCGLTSVFSHVLLIYGASLKSFNDFER